MIKQRPRRFAGGQAVKITGTVGIVNSDDSSVESVELRGEEGHVAAVNGCYTNAETGEQMVGMTLDNGGALTAVPARALSPVTSRARAGWSRRFANAWRAIFDS